MDFQRYMFLSLEELNFNCICVCDGSGHVSCSVRHGEGCLLIPPGKSGYLTEAIALAPAAVSWNCIMWMGSSPGPAGWSSVILGCVAQKARDLTLERMKGPWISCMCWTWIMLGIVHWQGWDWNISMQVMVLEYRLKNIVLTVEVLELLVGVVSFLVT